MSSGPREYRGRMGGRAGGGGVPPGAAQGRGAGQAFRSGSLGAAVTGLREGRKYRRWEAAPRRDRCPWVRKTGPRRVHAETGTETPAGGPRAGSAGRGRRGGSWGSPRPPVAGGLAKRAPEMQGEPHSRCGTLQGGDTWQNPRREQSMEEPGRPGTSVQGHAWLTRPECCTQGAPTLFPGEWSCGHPAWQTPGSRLPGGSRCLQAAESQGAPPTRTGGDPSNPCP